VTNEQRQHFRRVRAVCCQLWSIPPWQFDEACAQGKLTAADIEDALDLVKMSTDDVELLLEWLRPGTMELIKQAREEEEELKSWNNFIQRHPGGA